MSDFWIILLEIIIALLGAYLIYYARQKGKNQADKEDIAQITKNVEEIKHKYSEDIEMLKAELSLIINKKSILFTDEKEAIIQYFAQYNKWLWDGLNVHITEYNHTNFHQLSDKLIKMRDDYNQTNIAFAKLQLLVNNEELINKGLDANIATLKLHHFEETLIQKMERTLSWEKIMINQITNKEFDFRNAPKDLQDFFIKQAEDNKAELKKINDEYFQEHPKCFDPAIKLRNEFKNMSKKYLNDLK